MIEVQTRKNNTFIVTMDDQSLSALMFIVANSNRTELPDVGSLIRYELDYMVEKMYSVMPEPNIPNNGPLLDNEPITFDR